MSDSSDVGLNLFRPRGDGHERATYFELFFDLVYVFAVTQLSHTLIEHLTWRGAAETGLLLLAVWCAWIYTTWFTNWFDPDQRVVRLVLLVTMLASLLMSAAIPEAFGERGLLFAGAYAALHVFRTSFVLVAGRPDPLLHRNFQRISIWLFTAAGFWVAGGLAHGDARIALWVVALGLEYGGPPCGYRLPRLGRSTTADWQIAGGHMAERCALFMIVALGESILVTGTTYSELDSSGARLAALIVAFAGSVALWWIYFDRSAAASTLVIEASDDPGRLGRSAFTYVHIPLVAGVIVVAAGDELAIARPTGTAEDAAVLAMVLGPLLFLVGHALFKWVVWRVVSIPRVVGIACLLALLVVGQVVSALVLTILVTVVLTVVAALDAALLYDPATRQRRWRWTPVTSST